MKKASDIRKVMAVLAIASLFGISACVPIIKSVGAKPGSIKVGKTTVSDVERKSGRADYSTPDQRFFMYSYHRESGVFILPGPNAADPVDDFVWTMLHGDSRLLIEFDDSEVVVNKLIHRCKKEQTDGICDQPASKSIWALIGKLHGDEYVADYQARMARFWLSHGLVPLSAAAFRSDTEEMRSLIEQGADANVSDRNGNTALHIASDYGSQPAVKILLPMIHDLNAGNGWGYTALHYAAKNGHIEILQLLISNGADANVSDRYGDTALHIASDYGSQPAVKILLPMIHDLNAGNGWGYTALHYAAKNGHIEILQLLISNGADVNQQNAFGRTPLHAAAQIPSTAPAKLLLAAGADPDIRDADGLLPIDIAKQRQNERVSRLLNTQTHQN